MSVVTVDLTFASPPNTAVMLHSGRWRTPLPITVRSRRSQIHQTSTGNCPMHLISHREVCTNNLRSPNWSKYLFMQTALRWPSSNFLLKHLAPQVVGAFFWKNSFGMRKTQNNAHTSFHNYFSLSSLVLSFFGDLCSFMTPIAQS